MKVLHVFHGSDLSNGVDQTTLTLAIGLMNMGATPHAIVPKKGMIIEALNESGIAWHLLPLSCCSGPAWRAQLRYLQQSGERATQLESLMNNEKFDVVHLNTGHLLDAALAAASARIPVIWHIHGPFEIDYQRYADFLSPEGYAWILEALGSQVIAVSDEIRDGLLRYLPPERVHTVYNGIDVEGIVRRARQGNTNIRDELGLSENARLVLGVGRISEQKDFAAFVRVAQHVAKKHPLAYFAIAGPPQKERLAKDLEMQIQTLGLKRRVFLLGRRNDVPRLMADSDVLLSTSIYEGHPLAVLEMMTLGRPVVAMACIGMHDCIRDGVDGLLVPPGDVKAAGSAVLRVLDDPSLARRLGTAGRQIIEQRFTSRSYAQRFLEITSQAVEYGPSRVAPGTIDLIRGLLSEIGHANRYIKEMEAQKGLQARVAQWAHTALALLKKHQA